jgi:hypothetical protein
LEIVVGELREEVGAVMQQRRTWEQERSELEEQLRQAHTITRTQTALESTRNEVRDTTTDSPADAEHRPWETATPSTVGQEDTDDSFDWMQHVSALAARLRGESQASATPAPPASVAAPKVSAPPVAADEAKLLDTIPVRRDNKSQVDLSALRCLANQNARTAIGIYEHRQGLRLAAFKWLVALAAVVSGGGVMYIYRHRPLLGYSLAGICWTVAAFWSCRGALVYRQAVVSRSRLKKTADRTAPGVAANEKC